MKTTFLSHKERGYYNLFLFILALGIIVFVLFMLWAAFNGYVFWEDGDLTSTGQFGDYVGGVIGTLFAFAGTILIFLSFQEQAQNNKRMSFESAFFEFVRLHKENVKELSYTYYERNDFCTAHSRKVFKLIYSDFLECFDEVKKCSSSSDPDDYYLEKYKFFIQRLVSSKKLVVDIIDLVKIDIAFCVIYYGLSDEGMCSLRKTFSLRYKNDFYDFVLKYLELKPKREYKNCFEFWCGVKRDGIDEIKSNISNGSDLKLIKRNMNCVGYSPYYGGHQNRLGHYFRNLFQAYKYINQSSFVDDEAKAFYGKILRAQLSNYEQSLLFINSISSLGMNWDYLNESEINDKDGFITNYELIKNVLGESVSGICYKNYYPKIKFEYEEVEGKW